MKKLILTTLTAIGLAGAIARADYQCADYNEEVSMRVNLKHITHFGDASIALVSATQKTQLFGKIQSDGGALLGKKTIEIYPFQGDTLTLVTKPKSCGRGSCDFNAPPIITASLKIGEAQKYFSCDEINP